MKLIEFELIGQRLHSKVTQQLLGDRSLFMFGIHHCAKPPRVMEPQDALAGHEVHVIVRTGRRHRPLEFQAS